jgi:hypothetical protein
MDASSAAAATAAAASRRRADSVISAILREQAAAAGPHHARRKSRDVASSSSGVAFDVESLMPLMSSTVGNGPFELPGIHISRIETVEFEEDGGPGGR